MNLIKCPRCESAAIRDGSGALSRTSRDGGAPVIVCDRCGQREALYGRDACTQIPMAEWPLEIGHLLDEEESLIRMFRNSSVALISADEMTP